MLTILLRVVADAVVVAIVLFAAAGTLAWPRAWVLLATLLIVRLATAVAVFHVHPILLRERAAVLIHREQPWADKAILLAFMATAFLGVPAIAALDAFRWHVLPSPPPFLSAAGLMLFALGWIITALALRENAFAVTVVRFQSERRHAVLDTGVYGVIRHPMYAGSPLVLLGLSLWLGSYASAVSACIPLGLLSSAPRRPRRSVAGDAATWARAARVRRSAAPGRNYHASRRRGGVAAPRSDPVHGSEPCSR